MDHPLPPDGYYNWDTYYQDPFINYPDHNVIYPNSQAYPSPAPSTASSTHNIMELGTMCSYGAVPQVFPGFPVQSTAPPPPPHPPTNPSDPLQFPCDELNCDRKFAKQSALVNHKKIKHSSLKRYSCDECPQCFSSTHERTMHKIHQHEGRRYSAKRPKKAPASSSPRRFDCDKCQEFFMHKTDLLNHVRNRHTGSGEFPCPHCSAIFYTYDMFVEHRDLHDNSIPKYSCQECDKKFLCEKKLKDHSVIHRERTFYKCEICSVVFVRSQTLQYHRMTCRAEFKCDKCVDSFMTQEGLDKHRELHLIAPDRFTCQKCNKTFSDRWTLQNHEKRHMLKMNYTCCVCGELIGTRAEYQKHLRDHLEANLRCRECQETFSNLVKYGYHRAEMHAVTRPYDCLLCAEGFCTRKELFDHLQNHNR